MRRITAITASCMAVAIMTGAAGCGAQSSDGPVTISFYSYLNRKNIEPVVEAFEKAHPEIKVDVSYGSSSTQYYEVLKTRAAGNQIPDVYNLSGDVMRAGAALDLTGDDMLDGIDAATLAPYSMDGKVYGMPVTGWVGALIYNKDLLKKAGYDTFPTTWDEFIEMGKALHKQGVTPFLETGSEMSGTFTGLLDSYYEKEGMATGGDLDQPIWDGKKTFEEQWLKPLQEWIKIVDAGVLPKSTVSLSGDQIKQSFFVGDVAVYRSGAWDLDDLRKSGINWAVAPIPAYPGGQPTVNGGPDQAFSISSKASPEKQKAAKTFLSFINSADGLKVLTENTGTVSLSKHYDGEVPAEFKDVIEQYLQKGHFHWVKWPKGDTAMTAEQIAQQQLLIQGKATPQEMLQDLQEKWDQVSQ